jgi:hypothetical protein
MEVKSRERILLIFSLIAVAIWVFDRFYYTPQKATILRLREEVRAAEFKLNESLILAKGIETLQAEVSRLEKERQGLRGLTLKGEEFRAFLKHLARECDQLQMKIISLIPQEERISPQEEKKKPSAFQHKKVNVQMVLHSTFPSLGTYIKRVEELPFLVTINTLQVEKEEKIFPLLKVTLGLSVHIISP